MPDDLYWRLDPSELEALVLEIIDVRRQEQEAANLRAGLITAMIANARRGRRPGARTYQPGDFFKSGGPADALAPDDLDRLQRIASGEILMRPD